MDHPVQCRCGTLKGEVRHAQRALHAVCYCRDCQAYAHALGAPGVLDVLGGTEVAATQPRYLRFTEGADRLACLSLTDRGLLRWYASCCETPIGNTARDSRIPYVGLVHTCLGAPEAALHAFGPVRVRVNTQGARAPVPANGLGKVLALAGFAPALAIARLTGSYRQTPFFTANGEPVRTPRVLTAEELRRARSAVQAGSHPA